MNPAAIIAAIEGVLGTAIELAPTALKLEQIIAPLAQGIWDHLVNKKVIVQDDIDKLNNQILDLSAQIQAPIPAAQPDDV